MIPNAIKPCMRANPVPPPHRRLDLHFTPRLLDELKSQGVKIGYVTLHVGLDTFAPVTEENPQEHKIHTEWCELNQETANLINQTKQSGGRVIAVGTTSVRTLESAANENSNSRNIRLHRFHISLHSSRLQIQNRGCDDHQLSFAQVHADYAGQRLRRARADFVSV